MSWLSAGIKKVRKAAGLPAITLGNVAKAGAGFIPIPGASAAVDALVNKVGSTSGAPHPTQSNAGSELLSALKQNVSAGFDSLANKAATAKSANDAYNAVASVGSGNVPLWLVGAGVALVLLSRKR